MSADNYSICPRCTSRRRALLKATEVELQQAYGHVDQDEYQELQAKLAELHRQVDETEQDKWSEYGDFNTLREDYEIYGADEGAVTVSYSGHCSVCGLGLDFKHEFPFEGLDE